MNLETLRSHYRDAILSLANTYKAENIRVFGSVARGENNEASDIDFLAHFRKEASLLDVAGLHGDLSTLLGVQVDVVPDNSIHWFIRDAVLREAIPL